MKNIFIYLLISFFIYASGQEVDLNEILYSIGVFGLNILSKAGTLGYISSFVLGFAWESTFAPDKDPNKEMLKAINNARKEIISRLDEIEENIKLSKKDILNEIRGSNYVNGFGKSLDSLLIQINDLVDGFNANDNSKELTENEKIVENSFLIGNNADLDKLFLIFKIEIYIKFYMI